MRDIAKMAMSNLAPVCKEAVSSASTQTKVCAGIAGAGLVTRIISKVVAKATKDEKRKEVAEGLDIIGTGAFVGGLGATAVSAYEDVCVNRLEVAMAEERSALVESVREEAIKMADSVKEKGAKLSRKEVKAAAELVKVLVEESTEEPELAELIANTFAEELRRK